MAVCEQNILDIALDPSLINPDEVVIFTKPDGTSVLRKWSVILGAITPADIEFQVGVTPGAPSDGDPTYTNAALIGKRVRVFRHFLKQTTLAISGGYSYSFNNVTGTITPSPAFGIDEVWSIEIY
jgi:hypothetical protein